MKRKTLTLLIIGICVVFLTMSCAYAFSLFGNNNNNMNSGTSESFEAVSLNITESEITYTNISEKAPTTTYKVNIQKNGNSSQATFTPNGGGSSGNTIYEFEGYVKLNVTNGTLTTNKTYLSTIQSAIENNTINVTEILSGQMPNVGSNSHTNISYTYSLEGNTLIVKFKGNFTDTSTEPLNTTETNKVTDISIEMPTLKISGRVN